MRTLSFKNKPLFFFIVFLLNFTCFNHTSPAEVKILPEKESQVVRKPVQPMDKEEVQTTITKRLAEELSSGLVEPLVKITHAGRQVSPFLKDLQDALLRMNDLSYNLVKGAGKYMEFNVNEMEKLQKEGWRIKGFTGLEGRRNTFEDLSGIICYHPEKNVITVVFHGTASNVEGWETNFDGQRFKPWKIQQEFSKDLFEDALQQLKTSGANKSNLKAFKEFMQNKLKHEDLSIVNVNRAKDMLQDLISANRIDNDLGGDLLHRFKLKLEMMEYTAQNGVKVEGEVHKGFFKKYMSTKPEVLGLLKEFINNMTPEQKKAVKIVFTGHSQAGGLGNIALADITANHGKELFGPDFDNRSSGKFYGYLLSAARAGNKDYVKWMHENIGKDYVVRQNVQGDPVPIASGDREMAKLLRELIPGAGEVLSTLADYDDVGHLLLDDGNEAWQRAKNLYGKEELSLDEFDKLDDAVHYIASWLVEEKSIPEFITSKKSTTWNPITKIKTWWNTAKAVSLINEARKGDEKARSKLAKLLEQRYAHLHYGHHREGMGAVFTPNVVGRDLDKMLQKGETHEMNRQAAIAKKKTAVPQKRALTTGQPKVR